jgi:replicative DNA helicase
MSERVLPHSLEAEKAVLGAAMVNPALIFEVTTLRPEHFFRAGHQAIWRVLLAMAEQSHAIDTLTVGAALGSELEQVGGLGYISGLTDGVPRSSNIKHYARIVREHALLRGQIAVANALLAGSYERGAEPRALLNEAQKGLVALSHETGGRGLVSAEEAVTAVMPLVERILETKAPVVGLATGYPDLDRLTRGLRPGELILLAARPSMGKTSFVSNIAERVASRGETVAFFSLEMSRDDVTLRLLASAAKLDFHRFMSGWVNQSDYSSISAAMTQVGRYALHIDDGAAPTLLDLSGQCRRLAMQHGLSLVILDYLQLMPVSKAENRNIAIAELSRGLKHLARELQVPIIALSQLSRDIEKRGGDKKPQLSDLRDSGALEQDADQVWFIHRPEVYAATPENRGKAELHVAKSRNGPTGIVPLVWRGERMSFEDAA